MMELFKSSIFWLNTFLVVWVFICSQAVNKFNGADKRMEKALVYLGGAGMIASIIRLIMIGVSIHWWWPLVIFVFSVIVGRFILNILQGILLVLIAIIGFVGIPVIWWFGGQF